MILYYRLIEAFESSKRRGSFKIAGIIATWKIKKLPTPGIEYEEGLNKNMMSVEIKCHGTTKFNELLQLKKCL